MTEEEISELMNAIMICAMHFMKATQESGFQGKGNGWSVTLPGPGISVTLKMDDFDRLKKEFK